MLAFSTTNEDDLLAIWSQTTVEIVHCENRTVQYLARSQSSVFAVGGAKTWAGDAYANETRRGRLGGCIHGAELFETEADFLAKIVTFRLVGGECGSDQVNILLQILCYPSLVWIFPSNSEVKTKKNKKKVFIAKSKAT